MPLSYVDAHVHFWDPVRLNYPWLAEVPAIAGLHTPETLMAEATGHEPAQIVFVQADCVPEQALAEVEWVDSLARAEPRIAAIVAAARVDAGPATITTLDALTACSRVRGVRHLIQGERTPGFCLRPEFVAGVKALASRRLSFDVCCRSHQLADVAELVRRCPEVNFILDHAGKPPIARGDLEPWAHDLAALAALPNIVCKLSGLVTEADPATWTPEQLAPFIARVLECFGPQRVLFGGDWPVVKLAAPYGRWLDVAQAAVAARPAADQDAIFRLNARRVYHLA